jgi:hypothetical protein
MDKILKELIENYERYLKSGERNLRELEALEKTTSCEFKLQKGFIAFWKMAINDFKLIADKYQHEHKNNKKRH